MAEAVSLPSHVNKMLLTEAQILDLVQQKAKLYAAWDNNSGKELPAYTTIYRESVEMASHISVHAEQVTFPDRLFRKKAPNEDEEQFQYRKDNYKPITKPFWERGQTTINRIWNKQNYKIEWNAAKEDAQYKEEPAEQYFTQQYPVYGSSISYFESIVTPRKINDPNAILCVKPYYIPSKPGENGEDVMDDTQSIEPVAVVYGAHQVVDYIINERVLILLDEKSEVEYRSAKDRVGLMFEYYDTESIWKITQVGKKTEWKFEIVLYYKHEWQKLPAQKLKGKPIQVENEVLYQSPFFNAVPGLDEALYDASTLQISKVAHAFPQRWEYANLCTADGCDHGYTGFGDVRKVCNSCKGTGIVSKRSPLGVLQLLPAASVTNEGDMGVNTPPFGYEAPDPTILEFLDKQIDKNIVRAFAMLNIDVSDSNVKGSETALGKQIDREDLFSMLLKISNETYDLLGFFFDACGYMRYQAKFNRPEIKKPADFAIRSEADLTEELKTAKDAGIPDVAQLLITDQYLHTRFTAADAVSKRINLIFKVDSLAMKDDLEVASGIGVGTVFKWQGVLHVNINRYIEEIMETEKDFLEQEFLVQKQKLEQKAKDELAANQAARTAELIDVIEQRQTAPAA